MRTAIKWILHRSQYQLISERLLLCSMPLAIGVYAAVEAVLGLPAAAYVLALSAGAVTSIGVAIVDGLLRT